MGKRVFLSDSAVHGPGYKRKGKLPSLFLQANSADLLEERVDPVQPNDDGNHPAGTVGCRGEACLLYQSAVVLES